MQSEMISELTATFEGHAQETESGVEYWLARDLQHLLGYAEWRNFARVIDDAKIACEVSENKVSNHFVNINKMVQIGSGTKRQIKDIMLKRSPLWTHSQQRRHRFIRALHQADESNLESS